MVHSNAGDAGISALRSSTTKPLLQLPSAPEGGLAQSQQTVHMQASKVGDVGPPTPSRATTRGRRSGRRRCAPPTSCRPTRSGRPARWRGWWTAGSPLPRGTTRSSWSGCGAKLPAGARLQLVIEPTRNAWVPLAAWFRARGVTVILVPPEQSADLRRYYQKHTPRTTGWTPCCWLGCRCCTPNGLDVCHDLGPADPLRRTVRRRAKLVRQRSPYTLSIMVQRRI